MTPMFRSSPIRGQRGAALFVALMILILLTILGLSAAQVTSLQERMASNYRIDNLAFQSAEDQLRAQELDLSQSIVDRDATVCRPDARKNPVVQWGSEMPTSSTADYESLQDFYGAGRSTGLLDASEGTVSGIEAGSWRCLMFRPAAVGLGSDGETGSAATVVQAHYIIE
jgi:Tfp pilus assembly protein PilX